MPMDIDMSQEALKIELAKELVPDPLLIWTPTLGGLYGSYV